MKKFVFILTVLLSIFYLNLPIQAGMLPKDWDKDHFNSDPDKTGNLQTSFDKKFATGVSLPTNASKDKNGLQQLQDLIINNLAQILRYIFIAISLLYAFLNILVGVLGSEDENKVQETRKSIAYIMLGLLLISLSSEFVQVFDIAHLSPGEIGNTKKAKDLLQKFVHLITLISGAVAIFYMFLAAIKMILSQGDDSMAEEEKKDFKYGFLGLIVIIGADVIINKVFYPTDDQGHWKAPGINEVGIFSTEVFGFLSYLLEFMAIINIVLLIVSAIYYMFSFGSEEQTKSAQIIILNLAMAFAMILFSYTLVRMVIPF